MKKGKVVEVTATHKGKVVAKFKPEKVTYDPGGFKKVEANKVD